jgi:CheR methyltransferase, SAM binding domain
VDLLVCRNTLMHLNAETQRNVVGRLHFALAPQGTLFLGHAEMLLSHVSGQGYGLRGATQSRGQILSSALESGGAQSGHLGAGGRGVRGTARRQRRKAVVLRVGQITGAH